MNEESGLTEAEQRCSDALVDAWNTFVALPDIGAADLADFQRAIHNAQRILATRVAARAYPAYWRLGDEQKEQK